MENNQFDSNDIKGFKVSFNIVDQEGGRECSLNLHKGSPRRHFEDVLNDESYQLKWKDRQFCHDLLLQYQEEWVDDGHSLSTFLELENEKRRTALQQIRMLRRIQNY